MVREGDPVAFVLQWEKINVFANDWFRPKPQPFVSKYSNESFTIPSELDSWVTNNIDRKPDRPLSLQLLSASRYGKTQWARSLGEHTYMQGQFDMENWNYDAKYIIWDDVDWQYLPNKKEYVGCQSTLTINPKYRKKLTLTLGIPTIFLVNSDIRNLLKDDDVVNKEYFNDNCKTIILRNKLY